MRSPTWFRLLQMGIGIVSIIASMIVIAYPNLAVFTIIILISIVLLIVGIERIITGLLSSSPSPSSSLLPPISSGSSWLSIYLTRSSRLINIGLGILAIAFAIVALAFPIFAAGFLIALVSFALLFNGIARIIHGGILEGGQRKDIPVWSRVFRIGVGALSIALSIIVIAFPTFGIFFLALILSVALLINGIEMIFLATTGRKLTGEDESNILP